VSLQFSRSLRSLKVDSFRASRAGMVLAIIFVFALLIWFFFAKVTLYEVSSEIEITSDGRIMAIFNEEGAKRIQIGQSAILRIEGKPDEQMLTIPALVIDKNEKGKVEIYSLETNLPDTSSLEKNKGMVEVEVEYVTPVSLVLRTSGKFINQSKIPISPQTNQETQK
jgi:hypothetical protein